MNNTVDLSISDCPDVSLMASYILYYPSSPCTVFECMNTIPNERASKGKGVSIVSWTDMEAVVPLASTHSE